MALVETIKRQIVGDVPDYSLQICEGMPKKSREYYALMEPLLKWPGGKRRLIPYIKPHLPTNYNRYIEPFCGGAALFFHLQPKSAVISDANVELIDCYRNVSSSPDKIIEVLSELENSEEEYYRVRDDWQPLDPISKSARIIYLCNLSFNGIFRVNKQGHFNVPYGRKLHLKPCVPETILAASSILQKCTLLDGDFSKAIARAKPGDLIYFDPPYTVAHNRNGFIKYNDNLFSWQDQMRLALLAKKLVDRGCNVVVSNADHDSIKELYTSFDEVIIQRHSIIAASNQARKHVTESLFIGNQK